MFTEIADAVSSWAVHLAVSPKVWLGVVFAGLSVALFLVSGFLRDRGIGGSARPATQKVPKPSRKAPKALPRAQQQAGPLGGDDGLDDEIAAILKRRGIS
jgi:hypothetical protein